MNREDIIRMARDAGFKGNVEIGAIELEHFAKLVAEHERKRIIASNAPEIEKINAHIKALEVAILKEREACAKVAKTISDKYAYGYYGNEVDTADEIESAIRARGQA